MKSKSRQIAIATLMLIFTALFPQSALAQTPVIFTNPTPANLDTFGYSIAVV